MMKGNRIVFFSVARIAFLFVIIGSAGFAIPQPEVTQTAEEVDPFYMNLLDEGRVLYRNGDPAGAVEDLTVACFGFLDSPARLLEGYVYLALCHDQLKNDDKARFCIQEIRRLKLEDHMADSGLPEDVAGKFADLALKVGRS
jgi:hypothetical protein